MKTNLLIKVRQQFNWDLAPRNINRANQRKWVYAMRILGGKRLPAATGPRKESP